jgi:hypothetical protein
MLESLYSCFSTSIISHAQLVAVQKELNIERPFEEFPCSNYESADAEYTDSRAVKIAQK